jgi:hypothetical protein
VSSTSWVPDHAHQSSPVLIPYVLTGDYWYFEELLFWVSWSAGNSDAARNNFWGRGPTGSEGGISGQIRGQAWTFRTRAEAARIAPDGHLYKKVLRQLVNGAIANWEGQRRITGTEFENNDVWSWAYDLSDEKWSEGYSGDRGVPKLGFWEIGTTRKADQWGCCLDLNKVSKAEAPWEQWMMVYSLGRAKELGYSTSALLDNLGEVMIGMFSVDPYLTASYRGATIWNDNEHVSSWEQYFDGYRDDFDSYDEWIPNVNHSDHGYALMAMVASSMLTHLVTGEDVWEFMEKEALISDGLNDNPKWAITPR